MDKLTETVAEQQRPSRHFLGKKSLTHVVQIRGKSLIWKVIKPKFVLPPMKTRGEITGFSRQSRLRLLIKIAQINWQLAGRCLLVTLTFPNKYESLTTKKLSQYKAQFLRDLEIHLGKKVTALWRTEWEVRKSGKRKGTIFPHFHLLIFRTRYIDKQWIKDRWRGITGYKGYIHTDVRKATTPRKAALYAAKYCAKPADGALVNSTYHNKIKGRPWGVVRAEGIDYHPAEVWVLPDCDGVDIVREQAANAKPLINANHDGSFTALGSLASELEETFRIFVLAGG